MFFYVLLTVNKYLAEPNDQLVCRSALVAEWLWSMPYKGIVSVSIVMQMDRQSENIMPLVTAVTDTEAYNYR